MLKQKIKNKSSLLRTVFAALVLLVVAALCSVSIGNNYADAKKVKDGKVHLSVTGTASYSGTMRAHVFKVIRDDPGEDKETIKAVCGNSMKPAPGSGNYTAYRQEISAENTGRYNIIKYLLLAYKYNYTALFDDVPADSFYMKVHAVVSKAYSGNISDGIGTPASGLGSKADDVIDAVTNYIEQSGGFFERRNRNGKVTKTIDLASVDIFVLNAGESTQPILWIEDGAVDVRIKKQDVESEDIAQGDASVVGAKFKIYDDDGDALEDNDGDDIVFTINSNGNSNWVRGTINAPGRYTVKETHVPDGYKKMDNQTVEFTDDDQGEEVILKFKNEIIRGDIKIQKCDENKDITGVCVEGDKTLSNIEFEIINKSENSSWIDPDGKDTKADRVECKVNKVCATIKTDENGVAKTTGKALPYGTYLIREKQGGVPAETGLLYTQNEWTVRIREEGKVYPDESGHEFRNIDQAGDVEVQKCDIERLITTGDCGNGAPQGDTKLAGISFQIINKSQK